MAERRARRAGKAEWQLRPSVRLLPLDAEAAERHVAAVRATIPAERLLEFEASQGWEPLCAFLGVPVPDAPFPRTNSREEFWQHVDKAKDVTGIDAAPVE